MTELTTLSTAPLTSTTDQVFDAMYRAIIKLDLPPGSKVSEADVSKQLGVSRQPVRDAFFRLSDQGFLVIRPQRATLITKISEQAVQHATFVRIALEVACVVVATRVATKEDINKLKGIVDAQKAANDKDDREGFHDLDDAFHKCICEIAGHPDVWTLIREQKAHMDRVRFLSLSQGGQLAYDEHLRLLAAIEAGDEKIAEEKLRDHLQRIVRILPEIRADHDQYFEDHA